MKTITILCFVVYSFTLNAQTTYLKTFGGLSDDELVHVSRMSNGNFLLSGSTLSYGNGGVDASLVKLDAAGNILWSKVYGGAEDDYFEWAEETNDRGIIAAGYLFSVTKQKSELIVVKTDSAGTIEWQNKIGLADVCRGYCIRETFDHGYILCGEEDSTGLDGNMLIVKLDSAGNLIWNKSYGIPVNADVAHCIIQTKDSGYAVCGQARYGLNSSFASMMRLDSNGALIWSKNYFYSTSGNSRSYPNQIMEVDSGNFIVSGSSYLVGQPLTNALLISLDSTGHVNWSNLYSTGAGDVTNALVELPEQNGFLLGGYTASQNTGATNALLLKTDVQGNLLTNVCFGNDTIDSYFNSLALTNANEVLAAGGTYSLGLGGQDGFVVKEDSSQSLLSCYSHSVAFSTIPFPLINNGSASFHPLSLALTSLNYSENSGGLFTIVCQTTGLDEILGDDDISIYPNPGHSSLNLINKGSMEINRITVLTVSGKMLMDQIIDLDNPIISLNMPELSKGVYIIKIESGKKEIIKKYILD